MENEKQLSAVSSNTRNRGHKMKLVGGRLNKKKKKETDPCPTRSRTVEVTATGCWGHQNFTCVGHTHGKRKIGQGRVDKRHHSLAQEVLERLWKIFRGKYHCNLKLLSYISSSHCWQPDTGLAEHLIWSEQGGGEGLLKPGSMPDVPSRPAPPEPFNPGLTPAQ